MPQRRTPRQIVDDLQGLARVTPQANPSVADNYVRPQEQQVYQPQRTNPLLKLSDSLSALQSDLKPVVQQVTETWTKEQEAQAVADFQANKGKWSEAVRRGEIPLGANPHAARAVKRLMLSELADDFHSSTALAFQGPEGQAARESNDPQVMRQFLDTQQQKFFNANLKNGDKDLYDPLDIQEAWVPKMARTESELMRAHANYRVSEVEKELKDTVGATISRAVDDTFQYFTPETSDEERKQRYRALGQRISDTLTNPDHGALGTGLDRKVAWDLVTDTIVARALASRDHGRDILDVLDHIQRADGPALRDTPYVQQKRLQAEEHLTSLEIQRENHEWAQQDRPYTVAAKERQVQEWQKQDERWEREKAGWQQQDAAKADSEIFRSLSRRVYEGLRRPDSKQGVAIINDAIRQAETVIPEQAERLRSIADTMTQRRLNVEDDPLVVAQTRARISRDPLSVRPDDLVKLVKAKQISAKTMMQLQDDLDRTIQHSEHPFMRQQEITEMLHQVAKGAMQNPADEFSAEGQMRVANATNAFRDKAASWIEAHPQGGMAGFRDYMRDQIGPILERTNKDYGAEVQHEREMEEARGRKAVAKAQDEFKQREKDEVVLRRHQEAVLRKEAEAQRKRDEVTHFNQAFKPTGKKTKEGRDILFDGQGKIASEQTITIQGIPEINNGGITNIPTVFKGKKYPDEASIEFIKRTKGIDPDTGLKLRRYWSLSDAQIAAREKSNRIEKEYADELKSSK